MTSLIISIRVGLGDCCLTYWHLIISVHPGRHKDVIMLIWSEGGGQNYIGIMPGEVVSLGEVAEFLV